MKLTIIVSDKCVYVDGKSWTGLDLSTVDANVHALQWDGKAGWIEYNDGSVNKEITTLPSWAQYCVDQWKNFEDLEASGKQNSIAEQLIDIYSTYPIANLKAISKLTSTAFRNITLTPKVRETDNNIIGIQVAALAGEKTGTGAIGVLSIIDATKLALSLGIPIFADVLLPEDKQNEFKTLMINQGYRSLDNNKGIFLWYPWSFELEKASKKFEINCDRDTKLDLGFTFKGYIWDISSESRNNITSKAAVLATGLDTSIEVLWRTKNNINITLSSEDFKQLATSMVSYVEDVYLESWNRKSAVDFAITLDEIKTI